MQKVEFRREIYCQIERYFYAPKVFDYLVACAFFPLSVIYSLCIRLKKFFSKPKDFGVKIISVGNLIVGGSGKTPLVKAIYENFSQKHKTFIILRGYKRNSSGQIVVANNGKILVNVDQSGDEAMEYAKSLKNANIIVSEDRKTAINYAKEQGAKLVILDDGFSKFDIKKFDILLKPSFAPKFELTLPSGAYRYPLSFYKFANFIPANDDIIKKSEIINQSARMVLVSAIANPARLHSYFKLCVGVKFYPDHHQFSADELHSLMRQYNAISLLVTMKDFVKIEKFNLNISLIFLKTQISPKFRAVLEKYIEN